MMRWIIKKALRAFTSPVSLYVELAEYKNIAYVISILYRPPMPTQKTCLKKTPWKGLAYA